MSTSIPQHARVVIVGGGIIGCSVAYHLTKLGWTDVVLLEQGQLSCGTTWHAAGLVGQLRAQESMTKLIRYSTALYAELEADTGLATGWKQCGSLSVARTAERMTQLKRTAAVARAYGVTCDVIGPQEAGELWPVMRTDDRSDPGPRPRRPHARRADRRKHACHCHPHAANARRTRGKRPRVAQQGRCRRHDQRGNRRELRGSMGEGRGPPV
jgi:glycine/D-amino acid oxidase-like deaminating enzyme